MPFENSHREIITTGVDKEYQMQVERFTLIEKFGLGENISYIMFKPRWNDVVKVNTGFEVKGGGTIDTSQNLV